MCKFLSIGDGSCVKGIWSNFRLLHWLTLASL